MTGVLPPAGDQAIPAALTAAQRAADRIGADLQITGPASAVLRTFDGRNVTITFTASAGDPALSISESGDQITIAVDTSAATTDISVEVAAGITVVALEALPDAAPLLRNGTIIPTDASLGRTDRRQIAILCELIYQYLYADHDLRPIVAAALNEQIDAMGLGLDHDPTQAQRRRSLLPSFVLDDLAKLLPDWTSAVPAAPEVGGTPEAQRSDAFRREVAALRTADDWPVS